MDPHGREYRPSSKSGRAVKRSIQKITPISSPATSRTFGSPLLLPWPSAPPAEPLQAPPGQLHWLTQAKPLLQYRAHGSAQNPLLIKCCRPPSVCNGIEAPRTTLLPYDITEGQPSDFDQLRTTYRCVGTRMANHLQKADWIDVIAAWHQRHPFQRFYPLGSSKDKPLSPAYPAIGFNAEHIAENQRRRHAGGPIIEDNAEWIEPYRAWLNRTSIH